MEATKRDIILVKKGYTYVLIDENNRQTDLYSCVITANFNLKEIAMTFPQISQKHICHVFAETPEVARKFSLEWKTGLEWKGEKMDVLEKLWNNKLLMDCVIVASNKAEIMCHRSILAATFCLLCGPVAFRNPKNRIYMEESCEESITALVQYFYKNEIDDKEIVCFRTSSNGSQIQHFKARSDHAQHPFANRKNGFSLENVLICTYILNKLLMLLQETTSTATDYCVIECSILSTRHARNTLQKKAKKYYESVFSVSGTCFQCSIKYDIDRSEWI
ncbi:BTB and MATH domain-containing protein 42 [Orchesella cincta]|uniref:BTB and MATH domain-containing protein 42 n=1 Tax=Orchesella cincta TaxID=48709 RepID=A0A1D2M104_ORCCI|nr:BTB and MATH domain-containing protein 42 [Orchesella cincta]